MTNTDVIRKLIGNINPAGDSSRDGERFDNLKAMCELVEDLLSDINFVAGESNAYQSSIRTMGEYAKKFIENLKEEY